MPQRRKSYGFKKAADYIRTLAAKAMETLEEVAEEVAVQVKDHTKKSIYDQSLDLAPLSSSYAAYKEKAGLDPRILIATGYYVDRITVLNGGPGVYFVGVPNEAAPNGVSLTELSTWLEFGTTRMPPRPHFEPADKWMNQRIPLLLAKAGFIVTTRRSKR